jgi:hypothetical protein
VQRQMTKKGHKVIVASFGAYGRSDLDSPLASEAGR